MAWRMLLILALGGLGMLALYLHVASLQIVQDPEDWSAAQTSYPSAPPLSSAPTSSPSASPLRSAADPIELQTRDDIDGASSKNGSSYQLELLTVDTTKPRPAIGLGSCCGLGHRMQRSVVGCLFAVESQHDCILYWPGCQGHDGNLLTAIMRSNLQSSPLRLALGKSDAKRASGGYFGNEPPLGARKDLGHINKLAHLPQLLYSPDSLHLRERVVRIFRHYLEATRPELIERVDRYLAQLPRPRIGVHIRHGNGEGTDFQKKGRGIQNVSYFVNQTVDHVEGGDVADGSVLLFTDSREVRDLVAQRSTTWRHRWHVPPTALPENGVAFGIWGKDQPADCVTVMQSLWVELLTMTRMDRLVVTRYSSFYTMAAFELAGTNRTVEVFRPEGFAFNSFGGYGDF